jgi:hypothetical protein
MVTPATSEAGVHAAGDTKSEHMKSILVSTWMGDRLGTLGAVGTTYGGGVN